MKTPEMPLMVYMDYMGIKPDNVEWKGQKAFFIYNEKYDKIIDKYMNGKTMIEPSKYPYHARRVRTLMESELYNKRTKKTYY
jgi:hypothetical protein